MVVRCSNWNGSSVAMRYNIEDTSNDVPIEINGAAVIVTANRAIDLLGPGFVGGLMSSYGGTPVSLQVLDAQSKLPANLGFVNV